ncbi:hypothetical protein CGMCC3_g17178 [Colletotrichum fructicola]|uniref:Uncharacterized protein n=1 Tax=Colletotrichum fructicola (strain Nara gc5) TaxID=1213859 RepID=A0A7J6IEJ5_COLFN|nr:uncharacterized protein CGMCC3_g17178 [Colletotrichum fructicola]KAE9566686.1 hypothetical protein CGMCC3_g17178 [Colletotrichum fructicola]KAF4417659.1 hypothetical protein CFRS1_v015160 [Colletotrichum fructicola]KAF4474283.1 hypothetical protein CGGC5_v017015 [Colletotrichum fructicola Nara gc5]KAF4881163.1 hypothetical protein CGCFRS4_v015832 [Colletotrichum fructicola]
MADWRIGTIDRFEWGKHKRPEAMCRYVMEHRHDIFKNLDFNEYLATGLQLRKTDFDSLKILPVDAEGDHSQSQADVAKIMKLLVSRAVRAQAESTNKSETYGHVWKALYGFGRKLGTNLRCRLLTDAYHYFAKDLSKPDRLELQAHWIANFSSGKLRKRQRVEELQPLAAKTSLVQPLRGYIGTFLMVGLNGSYTRQQDINHKLTSGVEMHYPREMQQDFRLFVTIDHYTAEAVHKALSGPATHLVDFLGDWLFHAMTNSQSYKASTEYLDLYSSGSDGDMTLEVALDFASGNAMARTTFPGL